MANTVLRSRTFQSSIALYLVGLLLFLPLPPARAVDLQITAEFRPTALDPTHNRFVNTTPQSGYCAQHSGYCKPGDFTINTGLNVSQRRLFGGGGGGAREVVPRRRWKLARRDGCQRRRP